MPELPEVETIKKQITPHLPLKIKKIELSPVHSSILKTQTISPKNATIQKIERIGKVLHFLLDKNRSIISGLGMSGGWRVRKEMVNEKHTHILFKTDKLFLSYVDPRRFGKMHFLKREEAYEKLKSLGPDLLSEDFSEEYLHALFKKYPNKVLKVFLLDQKYFAGCGNYIASEVCALAGIRPTRKTGKITQKEITKLRQAFIDVLEGNIKNQGLTFSGGYRDAFGEAGSGVLNLVVFHQEICGICKVTPVKKIVQAQRSTFYCPKCQK